VGIEGTILAIGSAGFSPISTLNEMLLQITMGGLIRLGSIFHHKQVASIIATHHDLKNIQNSKQDWTFNNPFQNYF